MQRRRRKNDEEKQSALLQGEIDVIKRKFSNSQKNCNMLDKEFFNSVMQAEKMNDISCVHKGNALKRKNNEIKNCIKCLEEALKTLQKK